MAGSVVLEQGDEGVAAHGALRVRSLVTVARQHRVEVRRVHVERVPALAAPGLADRGALENQMVEAELLQCVADAKAGPAGADDSDIEDPGVPHSTSRG